MWDQCCRHCWAVGPAPGIISAEPANTQTTGQFTGPGTGLGRHTNTIRKQLSKTVQNFNITTFTAFTATDCWYGRMSNIFQETKPSFVCPFRPAAALTTLWEKLEGTTNAQWQTTNSAAKFLLWPHRTEVYNSSDSFRYVTNAVSGCPLCSSEFHFLSLCEAGTIMFRARRQ